MTQIWVSASWTSALSNTFLTLFPWIWRSDENSSPPLVVIFPVLTASASPRVRDPSPLHFIFNQSGRETLPGGCSNVAHPTGADFHSQGRHSISAVVITEDRLCSPSLLGYYLSPAEASPPPHENVVIIQPLLNSRKLNYSANQHWFCFSPLTEFYVLDGLWCCQVWL